MKSPTHAPARPTLIQRRPGSSLSMLLASLLFCIGILLTAACSRAVVPDVVTTTPTSLPPDQLLAAFDSGEPLPPQVIDHKPKGGQELPLDGPVVLTFDQAMDAQTTGAAWKMLDPGGRAVQGQVSWPTPRTLRFTPHQPLQSSSVYRVSLGSQATSAAGVSIAGPLDLQFNSVGDLQVSQVFPPDGATEVENRAVITAIFNRPVVPLGIAEDQAKLPDPLSISPEIAGKGEWVSTSVYAFHAARPLQGSTTYTVKVSAGLPDAGRDTQLPEDFTWQFTTIAPSIASLLLPNGPEEPLNNNQNIRLDQSFAVTFFQPMDRASTEASLSLFGDSGEPVSLLTAWNEDITQVEITPTHRLALGAGYTLKLDESAQAASGGALRAGLEWNFTTVQPPAVTYIFPPEGRQQTGFSPELQIKFASPMNIDSVKRRVVIKPQPEGEIEWWYNEWDWSMTAFALQPSTNYEVTTLPGMTDIYGNAIREGRTVRFTTPPYDPMAGLQMPYVPSVFRAGAAAPQEFYTTYRNVKSVEFKLYRLAPDQFVDFSTGRSDRYQYRPPEADLVWQTQEASTGDLNERVLKSFKPVISTGEPLPPGFYFLAMNADPVQHYGPFLDNRLLVVASANLTFKTNATEALVWLTGLESGAPVPGVALTVYDHAFKAIGQGFTGQDGLLKLEVPAPAEPYSRRFVLADGRAADGGEPVFAFASDEWDSGTNLYDFGLWGSYYAPPNQPKAYLYTDRPIYRPGQPVYFKGILRLDDDLAYSLPDQSVVTVKITDYKETIYEANLPLSRFGTFDGQINLDRGAALGFYSLEARLPGREEAVGSIGFSVAEYRKPEFQVEVAAEPKDVLGGQNFNVAIAAEYYSGGTVGGAAIDWTLRAEPFFFNPVNLEGAPDDLSGFSFYDYERDTGEAQQFEGYESQVVAEGQGQTSEEGKLVLSLPADLSDAKGSRQFTFEATLTDISKNAVSARDTVIAHRSALYVGARPESYVGLAGRQQAFQVIAVDWNGQPLPGQELKVEIVERRWHSVQEQDASGRVQWTSRVEEIPVESFPGVVADGAGRATVRFIPPKGGVYQAKVSSLDRQGNEARSAAYLWVSGEEFIPWRQTNDRSFDLVADRAGYAPGDTAEILIASPFQGQAYALVTVERGRIHHQEVVLLEGNSAVYRLPITASMAPNAFVSVVVIKGIDETNPRPNYRMGMLEIKVETSHQALSVEVLPDQTQGGPGEQASYTVRTRDLQGNPVSAEVSLGLSDLATLSLTGPNSSPILDYFYSYRTLGVWTSIPIAQSIEDYNASVSEYLNEGQGMGSGGAKGEGDFGVIDVRQNFPDTAFWEAHLETGEDGEASVSVTLPDNLTTWRMDARAVTLDTRVGQTTQDLISTRPLLVRPQTPRFFVAGDQARLGAAVHNNTGQPLSVAVSLDAQGVTLQGEATQQIEVPANRQAYISWEAVVAMDAQRVDLVFRADSAEAGLSDASRPPQGTLDNQGIPVYRFEAHETVGTSGQMASGGTRLEAISLPDEFNISQGSLSIQIAPSLAAGMTDGLKYLEEYPYECVEQTISRFLPNVISTRALAAAGLDSPDLEANLQTEVNKALQRLYNWQNPDGGWSWWPGSQADSKQKSDPQTSAYVILGLVEAREAGYTVSQPVIERATRYLRNRLERLPAAGSSQKPVEAYRLNRQAFLLYVLARAGAPEVSASVLLYDRRQSLAIYARAYLAHTLYLIDSGDPRLNTLLSDFASAAVISATGSHWEEKERDPWNWNTDTRTTAIVLSALSQIDPGNPLNANAVRWLMSSRTGGHWQGTQETAWTLMALTNWMVASGELQANYRYAVAFNGQQVGGGEANASTLRQTYTLQIGVADMLQDQANRLAIAREDGPGSLYYTAHLDVSLPVDQIEALDQGIVVSRSYYRPEDPHTPVTQAQVGELLYARLTVVAPNALHYAVVDDPLPAGLEAVDQALDISPQNVAPQTYGWDDLLTQGWGWWHFEHVQLRDEKTVLSASYLPAGTYVYTYMVRASTAGVFRTIPPTAQEFYFPEVYGRGAGSLFTVTP